jgi:ferredoxin
MNQAKLVAVYVDHNVCVGNAMCRALSPSIFTVAKGGRSTAPDSPVDLESAQEAAENCPVGAIKIKAES